MSEQEQFQVYSQKSRPGVHSAEVPGLGYPVLRPWPSMNEAAAYCRSMMSNPSPERFGVLRIVSTKTGDIVDWCDPE